MPSVVEIIYCEASEGYNRDLTSLDRPLGQISKTSGWNRSYVGYQTEDTSVLFWVNDWVTKDARDAADASIAIACHTVYSSEPMVNHVEFEDAKGALGAPVTEFVTFTLKEGKSMSQLEPLVQEIHQKLAGTPRFHGDSWAPIIGKSNAYHGILGWDTVEAHWDAVSSGPLKEVIDQIKLVADLWLVHAELKPLST